MTLRQLNIKIDKELIKKFQHWCIDHETTMKAELTKFIESKIKEK